MPPKKKGGKSKSKKKGKDVDPEEKLRQDLLLRALSLQGEAAQENAFEKQISKQSQLSKEYWEIEKKTKEERNRTLLEKEHRLNDIRDRHIIDLGQYKQIIKKLLFANQDELSATTTQSFTSYQSLSERHQNEVGQLHNELHDVSNRIQETATSYDKFAISMRRVHDDEATMLREEARRKIATLAIYSEKQFKRTREESERRLMEETKELETRNEGVIREVMEKNKMEIQEMRSRYSAAMNDNLDTITSLRKEVVLLREQDRYDRRVLSELRSQNNGIVIPLETNRSDLHRLESDLDAFHQQKKDLDTQKARLRRAEDELKEIEWDHEVLFQKLQASEIDRDEWKKKARDSVHSARQAANFRNLMLERKLSELSMTGEKKTAAMAEILQKGANIDLTSLDQSQVRVVDVVNEKNDRVELLRKELKRVKDAHAEMLDRHRALLDEVNNQTSVKTAT
mmetsp:Transcript_35977/g.75631  ORF Transcript_35977/g.75631 Transcript_35977/m.75631 type:complete len:455 (-) Transcript_35977:200-1564(-)